VCAAGAKTESKNTDEILPRRVIEEIQQKLKPEDTHPASVHAYQKNPGVLLKTHKFLYLAHDEFKRSLENISRSILRSFSHHPYSSGSLEITLVQLETKYDHLSINRISC